MLINNSGNQPFRTQAAIGQRHPVLERSAEGAVVSKAAESNLADSETNRNISESVLEDSKEKFKQKPNEHVKIESAEDLKIAAEIRRLKMWENHVKQHEQAHMSVAGGCAGSPCYVYEMGPDGKRYISGGEVTMYVPAGASHQDSIEALERIKRAAMAPSDPSPQDLKAAATASAKQLALITKLTHKKAKEAYEKIRKQDVELKELKGEYLRPTERMDFAEFEKFELFI